MNKLGRFNHHPDPAIDFCVEVDALEGLAADVKAGVGSRAEFTRRYLDAMEFRVGGDEQAVSAKQALREISL